MTIVVGVHSFYLVLTVFIHYIIKTNNMRLFIDNHYFISVIQKENVFNCQVMELIHGNGMYSARLQDDQSDVVSGIVFGPFSQTILITSQIQNLFEFHKQLIIELTQEPSEKDYIEID